MRRAPIRWRRRASWTAYTAGRAATPPMGWNSWNAFASTVDEEKVMGSAQAHRRQRPCGQGLSLHQSGRRLGGQAPPARRASDDPRRQISVDGAASTRRRRRSSRTPTSCTPWVSRPASIRTWAATPARRRGAATDEDLPKGSVAEREVGLHDHIEQDIELYFREWGFDYIKVDGCGLRDFGPNSAKVKAGSGIAR